MFDFAYEACLCYHVNMEKFIDSHHALKLSDLGHANNVNELASLTSGVVLISGRHGSGKSTTLTALASEIGAASDKFVSEIVTSHEKTLGFPLFTLGKRSYKSVSKNPKLKDLEAAHYFTLMETAGILEEGIEVALFDDIRHAEAALMASYLAKAGVLVIASIHNSGDVKDAVKTFTELPRKLSNVPLDSELVKAVVHQSLTVDGTKVKLASSVYIP